MMLFAVSFFRSLDPTAGRVVALFAQQHLPDAANHNRINQRGGQGAADEGTEIGGGGDAGADRRIFTRYDNLDIIYLGFLLLALIFELLR